MEPLAFCCAESDIFPHLSSDQLTLVICYIYIYIRDFATQSNGDFNKPL